MSNSSNPVGKTFDTLVIALQFSNAKNQSESTISLWILHSIRHLTCITDLFYFAFQVKLAPAQYINITDRGGQGGELGYNTVYQVIQIDVKFSFKGVCSSIVRGSGRQTVGVVINFISYCCCGLPLGIVLMFLVFHDVTGTKHESVFASYYKCCQLSLNRYIFKTRYPELVPNILQSFSVSRLS